MRQKVCLCGCGLTLVSQDSKNRPTKYIRGHHVSIVKSKKVAQYTLEGKFIKMYANSGQAARINALEARNIRNSASGRRWSAGGYLWKYTDNFGDLRAVTCCQCCGKKVGLEDKVSIAIDCLQKLKGQLDTI